MTMNYSTGSTSRGKLGPEWQTPDQINAGIDAQLAAQKQADQSAAAGVFAWSELDSGRKDFTGTVSAGPPGQGCNLTGWMNFAKRYSQVEEFSFKDANWTKGNGAHLHYVGTDFRGADLSQTSFDHAVFEDCLFDENTRFNLCGMDSVKFTGTSAQTAPLAKFTGAEFNANDFQPDPFGDKSRETGISKPDGVTFKE